MLRALRAARGLSTSSACRRSPPSRPPLPLAPRPPRVALALRPTAASLRQKPHPALARHLHTTPAARFRFTLHDIGEGITEVDVVRWHVSPGDAVDEFDSLCEVQSDKSVVDISSPCAGTITHLAAGAGGTVRVGELLCEIDTGEAAGETSQEAEIANLGGAGRACDPAAVAGTDEPDQAAAGETPSPNAGTVSPSVGVESGSDQADVAGADRNARAVDTSGLQPTAVSATSTTTDAAVSPSIGETSPSDQTQSSLSSDRPEQADGTAPRFAGEAAVVPPPPRETRAPPQATTRRRAADPATRTHVLASPAVRALAGQLGVDLGALSGSGQGGRVERGDVEAAARGGAGRAGVVADGAGGKAGEVGRARTVKMGKTRRVMYRAMAAQAAVPHFGYSHSLDLTGVLPLLRTREADPPVYRAADLASAFPPSQPETAAKASLLGVVVKTLLLAAREHPAMRARVVDVERGEMEVAAEPVVGIAVSDPQFGLVTPSLALPPSPSLADVSSALAALRAAPTSRGPAAHLAVSSVGALGAADGAAPVLPPGTTAICVLGRARWVLEPVLGNDAAAGRGAGGGGGRGVWDWTAEEVGAGGVRARLRVPVGWSGDHRLLEGAELIAFTETWRALVANPTRWATR